MMIPPIIPAIIPDNGGAPDAKAIPKHKGKATRKTTMPDEKFSLILEIIFFFIQMNMSKQRRNIYPKVCRLNNFLKLNNEF